MLVFTSDRLTREVRLRVALGFPRPPEPSPAELELCFAEVTHTLLFTHWNWPGPGPYVSAQPTPEMEAALAEYQGKGRAESSGFDFIQRCIDQDNDVEVLDSQLHRHEAGITFVLAGFTNDLTTDDDGMVGWQLRIGAAYLELVLPDGSPLALQELMRLGMAGWNAFGGSTSALAE